jgi:hypothetical protein
MLLELPDNLKTPDSKDATREIEVASDWLETSVLFSGDRVTKPEIADLLKDESIFSDHGAATMFVDDVWRTLRSRRLQQNGAGPFDFDYQDMHLSVKSWKNAPAHAFCLLVSREIPKPSKKKKGQGKKRDKDYTEQGELFERLVEAACKGLWPSWDVHRTGWSKTTTSKLKNVVEGVAKVLCGNVGNIGRWDTKGAKEQGLDLIWYRPFGDQRGCFPAFFVQCASGKHFKKKLPEPNEGIWDDLVKGVPRSLPRKAFATPFSFGKSDFERHAIQGKCLLLDRMRLLSAVQLQAEWVKRELARDLVKWVEPRLKKLTWQD